jgi:RNA polymerase sigma-70 factor (ECF subfamily)
LLETAQLEIRRYARATCRSSADAEVPRRNACLFAVVRRECLRLARKAGRVAPTDENDTEAALLSRPEADLRFDVAAALEALPPHYRGAR